MSAVITTGGKQYKVEKGARVEVEKLGGDIGAELELKPVLLVDGDTVLATRRDLTNAVVKANGIVDGYVRPVAWRGAEQMGVSAQQTKIHMAIATWEWPAYFSPEARMRGIRLAMAKYARPAPNTAPTKSKAAGLYMICTISKHAAEAEGYEDASRSLPISSVDAGLFFDRETSIGKQSYQQTLEATLPGWPPRRASRSRSSSSRATTG